MGHEEVKIAAHVFQLRPSLHDDRLSVQIVNLRMLCRQKKRRMGGDDKLAVEEARNPR